MHHIGQLTADQRRKGALIIALLAIGGVLYFLTPSRACCAETVSLGGIRTAAKDARYPRAQEIVDPAGFINTDEQMVHIADYIGKKVILVDFLTYSCINCVRTQPYLNAWQEKYADKGLQIIGIHTPEFEFEKKYENVRSEMQKLGVKYPVVLDNDYGTWHAYQNNYWPREYLVDIDGYVVYDHIGEGGHDETERKIQELLAERQVRLGEQSVITHDFAKPAQSETIDDGMPRTPETYFGAARNAQYLANGTAGVTGEQGFTAPVSPKLDRLYLNGRWLIQPEYARGNEGTSIHLRFQAKKVFFVARSQGGAVARIFIDGKPVADIRGSDIGADGRITIVKEQLYQLIDGPWGEHTLEIRVESGTLDAYTFTFG